MSAVTQAREAYEQAQKDSLRIVEQARRNLGKAIRDERAAGTAQTAIAGELDLSREQVRRFQAEYETAARDGTLISDEEAADILGRVGLVMLGFCRAGDVQLLIELRQRMAEQDAPHNG